MLLSDVKEFRESAHVDCLKRLGELNVRHVEQLGSLLAAPDGRYALHRLNVPVDLVQKALEPVIKDRLGLSLSNPFKGGTGNRAALLTRERHSMGYSAGDRDPFWEAAFETALPDPPRPATAPASPAEVVPDRLPSEITLDRSRDFTVRDQGRRGTCVAFTVLGMYYQMGLHSNKEPAVLSAQYLYYRAKKEDTSDADEEGTSIDAALEILRKGGCCLEKNLEYSPRHDIRQDYRVRGHEPRHKEAELRELARQHRIAGHREVSPNVEAVKSELTLGRPVGVGAGHEVIERGLRGRRNAQRELLHERGGI
jgi:hypothetical protein